MEISKTLQEDIMNIQQQLKLAIQNHQMMVLKQRNDPSNIEIKNEIMEVQKHIMSLGETQKHLVQRLRKQLGIFTNGSLGARNVSVSLGLLGNKTALKNCDTATNNNNNTCNNNNIHQRNCKSQEVYSEKQQNGSHRVNQSQSASVISSGSEDSEGLHETSCDATLADKVEFLSAVGLVTREVLSELQNRRVERKRRSTANHTQFVYGNTWDVTKRKKNSYLVSGSTPSQHATRQATRAQRIESPDTPNLGKPDPVSSQAPEPPPVIPSVTIVSQSVTTRTLVQADSNNPCSLRIPGLPESLTIERISSPQQVCVICRKTGDLSVCSKCSANYHSACLVDWPGCPHCNTRHIVCTTKETNTITDSRATLQAYIGSHKADTEERKAEKNRLKELNQQLLAEKEQMEQRAAELTVSLASQDAYKKDLLQTEEMLRKKIQRLHDFVTIIKAPRSATSS